MAQVRLARFPTPVVIEDDRTCAGTLWDQLDGAIAWLREHVGIRYEVRSESLAWLWIVMGFAGLGALGTSARLLWPHSKPNTASTTQQPR